MTTTLRLFGFLSILFVATLAYPGCQDQTCAVNQNGCFACQGAVGMACAPSGCDTCTVKLCGSRPGNQCKIAPDHLPSPHPSLFSVHEAKFVMEGRKDEPRVPVFMFGPIAIHGSPAQLGSLTINKSKSLIEQASIINTGKKTITAFQIGWVVGSSERDAQIGVSPVFEVPVGIEPKTEAQVPPQPFSMPLAKPGIRAAFFVSKVRFSDGTSWESDLKAVQKKALADGVDSPGDRPQKDRP